MPFWRRLPSELAGACGDLGTFIPHVIGAITIAGLTPAGILVGFGAFLIASGLFYGLPMAVQPMKAISALLVTGQVGPGEIAAAGILLGATLLILGLTGTIGWLARVIPQSVSTGLQLGPRHHHGRARPRVDGAHAMAGPPRAGAACRPDAGAALPGGAGDAGGRPWTAGYLVGEVQPSTKHGARMERPGRWPRRRSPTPGARSSCWCCRNCR